MEYPNNEGVGATAFDLPNDQNPRPYAPVHYGQTKIPHPVSPMNQYASREKVMDAVNRAK